MDQVWQFFDGYTPGNNLFDANSVVLSLLLAFLLGQLLAWVYYFTHSGLSYSRTFVQSLIIISIVVAMVMAVIGTSIITAFGLMGALAIIRFRNMVKDTRDIAFIFCALVAGMASGSQHFAIAIFGTVFLSLVFIYMHLTGFGTHQPNNGFLRFRYAGLTDEDFPVPDILKRFCNSFTLISVQNAGFGNPAEYAYQLLLRDTSKNELLLSQLEQVVGIENVTLTMQEQLLEI